MEAIWLIACQVQVKKSWFWINTPATRTKCCCTGIVSKECYELLKLNVEIPAKPANSAKFISSNGQHIRFWRNDNVALIIDRPALEQALVKVSKSTGTEYHFNSMVENIDIQVNRLELL